MFHLLPTKPVLQKQSHHLAKEMINLTKHGFKPDSFYPDHWISNLGNVCTRLEAERIVELDRANQKARDARNGPVLTREQAKELSKLKFEEVRNAA